MDNRPLAERERDQKLDAERALERSRRFQEGTTRSERQKAKEAERHRVGEILIAALGTAFIFAAVGMNSGSTQDLLLFAFISLGMASVILYWAGIFEKDDEDNVG